MIELDPWPAFFAHVQNISPALSRMLGPPKRSKTMRELAALIAAKNREAEQKGGD